MAISKVELMTSVDGALSLVTRVNICLARQQDPL
jgi:hypothetical protein